MSIDHLAATLLASLPGTVERESLTFLDEGFGSTVWRLGADTVIHVPRTGESAAGLARSATLLPLLRDRLPIAVPQPRWQLAPSPGLPFGAFASTFIAGVPLDQSPANPALARDVGAALAALHAISPGETGIPSEHLADRDAVAASRETVMAIALPWLRASQPLAVAAGIERWWEGFRRKQERFRYTPRLVHGDFWFGNMLADVHQERLVAVLDWERAALDDPAQDLATILHFQPAFAANVLEAYARHGGEFGPGVLRRRDLLWEYRELTGLAIAIQVDDREEIADSLEKLRSGPLRHSFDLDS